MPETLLPTEALPLPDFPAMPEPAVLKHPEDGEYDDDTAVKWAWFAHGYDTGMEPFFSAEQVKELMRAYGESVRAALAAAPAGIPDEILAIGERLRTQDNRITADPLFAVQQKRIVWGLDDDYADKYRWVDYDGECSEEDAALYDAKRENGEPLPDGVRRVGLVEEWEFVTGCLTEQGCKDYIAANGHNLHEPRIYAYGSYRNREWIALRKWLMSLPSSPSEECAQPQQKEN